VTTKSASVIYSLRNTALIQSTSCTRQIDIGIEGAQDAQVWASELDMIALVRNLGDNAVRYTPHGGRVDLSVRIQAGCAVLQVRDDGPGIRPAERDRVFDPFYRTLGTSQVGSGLGLSIVHAIAERIGARIDLGFTDEATQSGLCVTLTMPEAVGRGQARARSQAWNANDVL